MQDEVIAGPFTAQERDAYIGEMELHIKPKFNNIHYKVTFDILTEKFYVRHEAWV